MSRWRPAICVHRLEREQPPRHEDRAGDGVGDALREADGLGQRDQADDRERHAHRERGRLIGREAGHGQRGAEREAGDREHGVAARAPARGRLGRAADRGDDVQPAHAPGRDRHDDEREQHAERVGDDQAAQRHGLLDVEPRGVERVGHHRDHRERHADAERGAEQRGPQVVGEPLEDEQLHEMLPAGADRAGDAELGAPLRGEHHEDQEDQQDPGGDREAAEGREDGDEDVADLVGRLEAVLLGPLQLQPERRERRRRRRDHPVGELRPGGLVAPVGHEHVADLGRSPEQTLCALERHQHGCAVRSRPVVVDDGRPRARGSPGDRRARSCRSPARAPSASAASPSR